MALTATASQGFEFERHVAQDEILWLPGDPGITYTRGDLVAIGASSATTGGLLIKATDSLVDCVGVVAKTVICPAASQAFPIPKSSALWGDESAAMKTLIPVRPLYPAGTPVFKVTFSGHVDDTVTSYAASAGTMTGNGAYIEMGTGMATDDYGSGAYVYVYSGTGAGQINISSDYDHAGGTVSTMLGLVRPFEIALDSTSKIIVLAGEAAADRGMAVFGRIDAYDHNELHAADGSNDGDFVNVLDFRQAADYLSKLQLPVISARALFNA